ncbi:MAG: DNA-binding CsgD family transcriptional regulator [Polyangiales bacterium]
MLQKMEGVEDCFLLDPVRSYPSRGASGVAKCVGASHWRLEREGESTLTSGEAAGRPSVSLPIRVGRDVIGTIHLYVDDKERLDDESLRVARWAARILGRGLDYAGRLAKDAGRRHGPSIRASLARTSLTPRERHIVELLVSGRSTKQIASDAGLTVSTVNTYLKRVFAKLGVHSRVELVARVVGTEATMEE